MKWLGAGFFALVVLGFAVPAAAQDTPKAELSAGWNWLAAKSPGDEEWEKFPKGWYLDLAGNVTETFSVVGQITGNYKTFDDVDDALLVDSDLNVHTFMGGVRAGSPGRVKAFGQFLVGGASLKATVPVILGEFSETDFAIQVGGGVTMLGSGGVGLRLGLDWQRVFASDEGEVLFGDDVNGIRFSVGVSFGIGSR